MQLAVLFSMAIWSFGMMKSQIYNVCLHKYGSVKERQSTDRKRTDTERSKNNFSKETCHYDNKGKTNSNHQKHILAQDGERALFTTRTTTPKIRERQHI
jgi:hypothetical protein